MLASGWITDRVSGGRGSRTCLFCMLATTRAAVTAVGLTGIFGYASTILSG
jgi:sugar phosphate permease